MSKKDIRWIQRFRNFQKALSQLDKFVAKGQLNELEAQGLVKAFEYSFELAWNLLKDYLEYQGINGLIGSRDSIKEGFKQNLLGDTEAAGLVWMAMIKSRNLTAHAYNEQVVLEVTTSILKDYYPAFQALQARMGPLAEREDG
ncbi:MAG: nucleotidyltransferase substrate binding protein [bacterium]|nr:nucleotidyltransferase substrate binding protein [bacterium]